MAASPYAVSLDGSAQQALRDDTTIRWSEPGQAKEQILSLSARLDAFLASVERQALRIAWHYTGDRDEAMDLVQDAMLRLVNSYSQRPAEEWTPLFFRILRNRVRDWQRRQTVRNRVFFWRAPSDSSDDEMPDPVEQAPDLAGRCPDQQGAAENAIDALEVALRQLPARQREAFLLRTLDGVDVAAAANIMGVSQGSVKTHYSRAIRRLREMLGEHWYD